MAEVRIEHVSMSFGETQALAPVTHVIPAGTSATVTGANGAGKTTLLRALAGTLRPTTGNVRIGGIEPDNRNPAFRRLVATSITFPPLAHHLTLIEHLVLVGISWGHSPDDARALAHKVLSRFHVAELTQRFPHELSSGQTQILSLALTLIRPADVLILDEPEQRLDRERTRILGELLEERRLAGTTVVVSTHAPELAAYLRGSELHLSAGPGADA